MNEIYFFVQSAVIIGFALVALRLGSGALISWITVQALIANLFVLKQITLFGFDVTASDAFAIGSLVGLNLLQETFGQKEAHRATTTCFLLLSFFAIVAQLHLLYQPNEHDFSQSAFLILLNPSLRILLASMATFFVVQQVDIAFFGFLQRKFPTSHFALRTSCALILSQFLDTVLFSFLGLYGIVSALFDVILISFAIKLLSIISFGFVLGRLGRPAVEGT